MRACLEFMKFLVISAFQIYPKIICGFVNKTACISSHPPLFTACHLGEKGCHQGQFRQSFAGSTPPTRDSCGAFLAKHPYDINIMPDTKVTNLNTTSRRIGSSHRGPRSLAAVGCPWPQPPPEIQGHAWTQGLSYLWRKTRVGGMGPCLDYKFFHSLSITSNLWTHAWSIKCR